MRVAWLRVGFGERVDLQLRNKTGVYGVWDERRRKKADRVSEMTSIRQLYDIQSLILPSFHFIRF
jgi:hypothetical protein